MTGGTDILHEHRDWTGDAEKNACGVVLRR